MEYGMTLVAPSTRVHDSVSNVTVTSSIPARVTDRFKSVCIGRQAHLCDLRSPITYFDVRFMLLAYYIILYRAWLLKQLLNNFGYICSKTYQRLTIIE